MNPNVEWREVPGFSGRYSISEGGEVYSHLSKRVLRPGSSTGGYPVYRLSDGRGGSLARKAHRLVALAFEDRLSGQGELVLHGDGNPLNNRVSNLRRGNSFDNNRDTILHGRHNFAGRKSCTRGHPYTENSTYVLGGRRYCRVCKRDKAKERKREGLPASDPRHGSVNAYANFGCKCEQCKIAMTKYRQEKRNHIGPGTD